MFINNIIVVALILAVTEGASVRTVLRYQPCHEGVVCQYGYYCNANSLTCQSCHALCSGHNDAACNTSCPDFDLERFEKESHLQSKNFNQQQHQQNSPGEGEGDKSSESNTVIIVGAVSLCITVLLLVVVLALACRLHASREALRNMEKDSSKKLLRPSHGSGSSTESQ